MKWLCFANSIDSSLKEVIASTVAITGLEEDMGEKQRTGVKCRNVMSRDRGGTNNQEIVFVQDEAVTQAKRASIQAVITEESRLTWLLVKISSPLTTFTRSSGVVLYSSGNMRFVLED